MSGPTGSVLPVGWHVSVKFVTQQNMLKIKIPFKTPSVNHLYGYFRGRMFVKAEAKKMKEEIIELVKSLNLPIINSEPIKITCEIHEDWYYKKGGARRSDVANREKFLIDAVFEGLGIDDKWIFENKLIKKQNEKKEFAIIQIEGLEESSK